jgi:hypothetical protein
MLERDKLTQLSDDTDIPFDEILGQDAAGRVYVRNKWHVAAIAVNVPDTRVALHVATFELSSSRAAACQDSSGRIVAKLAGADHPFLSVYENGQFVDIPIPAGSAWISDVAYLQPLRDRGLVAQEQPGGDVFFFDGKSWAAFHSFRAMVEARYDMLTRLIDNRRTGVDGYAGLRVDSRGNIWCMQWDHVDAYDGKAWQSLAAGAGNGLPSRSILYCLPLRNGKVVLSDGTDAILAEKTSAGIDAHLLFSSPGESSAVNSSGLHIDAAGCAWLPRVDEPAMIVQDDHATPASLAGVPRLQDSAGQIWLVDPVRRQLVVVTKDRPPVIIHEDALSEDSTVVEQKPKTWWVNTRAGLRRLAADPSGTIAPVGDYFEKAIPKGPCNSMWLDKDATLNFSGSGRLYLIQLPKP